MSSEWPPGGTPDRAPGGGTQPTGHPAPGGGGEPGAGRPDRPARGAEPAAPPEGPQAFEAGRDTDPAGRPSIADTMAAELAGWAAGELPGQASARLAAWSTVGGAVARGRRQARLGGGGTAA